MDISQINSISTLTFSVIIAFFALVSLLTAYIFIKYGRNKHITILISVMFMGLFCLATINAFVNLQQIF